MSHPSARCQHVACSDHQLTQRTLCADPADAYVDGTEADMSACAVLWWPSEEPDGERSVRASAVGDEGWDHFKNIFLHLCSADPIN